MDTQARQATATHKEIQSEFDVTFKHHINQLLDPKHKTATTPISMASVACMTLLSERELEIEGATTNPPVRFNNQTILQELTELDSVNCLDIETGLSQLTHSGCIETNSDGYYVPQQPTMQMILLLEQVFPSMPGLSLVGYIVQTMQEVLSGRKELDFAISQFEQTLLTHGTSLSKPGPSSKPTSTQTAKAKSRHTTKTVTPNKALSRQEAMQLLMAQAKRERKSRPKTNVEQASLWMPTGTPNKDQTSQPQSSSTLSQQHRGEQIPKQSQAQVNDRSTNSTPDCKAESASPATVEPHATASNTVNVQTEMTPSLVSTDDEHSEVQNEILDHPVGDTPESASHDRTAPPSAEDETTSTRLQADILPMLPETSEPEVFPLTSRLDDASLAPEATANDDVWPVQSSERKPTQVLPVEKPAEANLTHADSEAMPMMSDKYAPVAEGEKTETPVLTDLEIERQIEAFSDDLAMVCPVCSIGKVQEKLTAKGQFFYQCSNDQCDLISWGKPLHQPCPICGNPFLFEITDSMQGNGLTCPRATCMFKQNATNQDVQASTTGHADMTSVTDTTAPKSRKKVVRRRVVRKKRRG